MAVVAVVVVVVVIVAVAVGGGWGVVGRGGGGFSCDKQEAGASFSKAGATRVACPTERKCSPKLRNASFSASVIPRRSRPRVCNEGRRSPCVPAVLRAKC